MTQRRMRIFGAFLTLGMLQAVAVIAAGCARGDGKASVTPASSLVESGGVELGGATRGTARTTVRVRPAGRLAPERGADSAGGAGRAGDGAGAGGTEEGSCGEPRPF